MPMAFDTPVALLVFNRPDLTRRVLTEIAKARPRRLLIVADGPRASHAEDAAKCAATRALLQDLGWDCDVQTNFSDTNMGCKRRVSSGLDWVFRSCDDAIILEDDCVPAAGFFPFCAELLERYRADERVCMIAGTNLVGSWGPRRDSYFFSSNYSIWGWATWRRAWQHYDVDMRDWPEVGRRGLLYDPGNSPMVNQALARSWESAYQGRIDTWDLQWSYACAKRRGLDIVPCRNLITNIGFGGSATHTRKANRFANLDSFPMGFPLAHPKCVRRDIGYEHTTQAPQRSILRTLKGRLLRSLWEMVCGGAPL